MYPLHKYVRTPFGTYLMYINHGPERVTVQSLPKDVKLFKKEHSRKPKQTKQEREKFIKSEPSDGSKEPMKPPLREVPPSYQIRFLEHNGQTVTEPPSNVIIVDDVTGADVTSSMTWIRSRPKKWKERVELHKIENPKMTSTLPRPQLPPPSNRSTYPAGGKLPQYRTYFDGAPMKEVGPPHVKDTSKSHPKLPQVDEMKPIREKARENREAREVAARKRRRRVNKIMNIVSHRALVAKVEAEREQTASTMASLSRSRSVLFDGTMAGSDRYSYLNGSERHEFDPRRVRRKLRTIEEPKPLMGRTPTDLTSEQLRGRATVHEEVGPLRIQDWNPREDQQKINRIIVERMGETMPYRWKEGGREANTAPVKTIGRQPKFTYVFRKFAKAMLKFSKQATYEMAGGELLYHVSGERKEKLRKEDATSTT